ncbi:hypothetical protein BaRGS_00005756, partial [Batillaria attramentaria]
LLSCYIMKHCQKGVDDDDGIKLGASRRLFFKCCDSTDSQNGSTPGPLREKSTPTPGTRNGCSLFGKLGAEGKTTYTENDFIGNEAVDGGGGVLGVLPVLRAAAEQRLTAPGKEPPLGQQPQHPPRGRNPDAKLEVNPLRERCLVVT